MAGRHSRRAFSGVRAWAVIAVVAVLIIGGGTWLIVARTHSQAADTRAAAAGAAADTDSATPTPSSEPAATGSSASGTTTSDTSEPSTTSSSSTSSEQPSTSSSSSSTASTMTMPMTSASTAATTGPFPQDQPAAAAGAGPCTTLNVLASLENADMITALGAAYSTKPRNISGHCVTVVVDRDKSGVAATSAATGFRTEPHQPAVWLPDSSSWLTVARADGASSTVPAAGRSVAQSPVVVAMPEKLASTIGWETKTPTWNQVVTTAENPNIWSTLGHPEYGTFKFGKTSPLVATSGLFGLLDSYGAAAGDAATLSTGDLSNAAVIRKVTAGELATSHYMATPEHFLWHVRQAADAGSPANFLSAVIVDEKSVWDYNRGISSRDGMTEMHDAPPTEKLVPIYPTDGVYLADNPAVAVNGSWVTSAQRAAAADFIRFLTTDQAQQVVRNNGYRDISGEAGSAVAAVGRFGNGFKTLAQPGSNLLLAAQKSFPDVRKKARVLFLLDASGSMSDTISPGVTKLQAAKQAVTNALGYFTGDDEVGLAAFSNFARGPIVPAMIAPVAPYATGKSAFLAGLNKLQPISETPLYAAIDQFASQMASQWQPDKINAVVVLSDGKNDTTQKETLNQLTTKLKALDKNTPTLVFTLAYGKDADSATLQTIAYTSGAHYYDATDPTTIDAVLGDLVTSF